MNGNAVTVNGPGGRDHRAITLLTAGGTATSASNFTLTASVSTPVVSSAGTANGQVGAAFSYQTTATNGPDELRRGGAAGGAGHQRGHRA